MRKKTEKRIPNKGYKFRIYPTIEQVLLLVQWFGCSRLVYNYFLDKSKKTYEETNKSPGLLSKEHTNYKANASSLVELKENPEFGFLNDCFSQTLQHSLKNLDRGFKNFFERRSLGKPGGFPKFKKKNISKQSIAIPSGFYLEGIKSNEILNKDAIGIPRFLHIPKFKEGIPIVVHREIKGDVVSLHISMTPTGKFYASFQVLEKIEKLPNSNNSVGIDLGLKDFIVTSNGEAVANPKFLKSLEKRLKRAQRNLSRKSSLNFSRKLEFKKKLTKEEKEIFKGRNIEKARRSLARTYEKITNQRMDFLQKLSTKLIHENQVICLEDLNISGMLKNHNLAKSIQNSGWSSFVRMLEYKAKMYGRTVVKVDRFFPSSKTCFECKHINHDLKLEDRIWICPNCGAMLHRDFNSSKSIHEEGLRVLQIKNGKALPFLAVAGCNRIKSGQSPDENIGEGQLLENCPFETYEAPAFRPE